MNKGEVTAIVNAVMSVADDNDKFGVLAAIIDAAWHPDHVKKDSEDPYDKAVVVSDSVLKRYRSTREGSYRLMSNVGEELGNRAADSGNTVLSDRFFSWQMMLNQSSFPPDQPESVATTYGES